MATLKAHDKQVKSLLMSVAIICIHQKAVVDVERYNIARMSPHVLFAHGPITGGASSFQGSVHPLPTLVIPVRNSDIAVIVLFPTAHHRRCLRRFFRKKLLFGSDLLFLLLCSSGSGVSCLIRVLVVVCGSFC